MPQPEELITLNSLSLYAYKRQAFVYNTSTKSKQRRAYRMNTLEFKDRGFQSDLAMHENLECVKYSEVADKLDNIDDPAHEWEYFGDGKYSRYAFSKPLGIKRGLSMGEFYGSSTVD